MPGRHVTDQQMWLFMKFRQTSTATIAAAKRDERVRAKAAVFHVIDFPNFIALGRGRQDFSATMQDHTRGHLGWAILTDSRWRFELRAVANVRELVQQPDAAGGDAITHVGTLWAINGRSFTTKESESALHDLHRFISFSRGHWTYLFGVDGQRANRGISPVMVHDAQKRITALVRASAIGKRYAITLNSVSSTSGATPPGHVAGTTDTGGQHNYRRGTKSQSLRNIRSPAYPRLANAA